MAGKILSANNLISEVSMKPDFLRWQEDDDDDAGSDDEEDEEEETW